MKIPLLAVAVLAVGAAAVALLQPRLEAAAPPSDISGSFAGKGSSKTSVLYGDLEGGSGGFALDAYASQEGNYLSLVLVVDPDGESQVWELNGRTGNGRFWAAGEVGEGESVVVTGTARGTPGKLSLKGTGQFLASDHHSALKFAVKQTVEVK